MSFVCSNIDQDLQSFIKPFGIGIDLKQVLDFKDPISRISNFDRLKRGYSADELEENINKYSSGRYGQILVKTGSRIFLLNTSIKRDFIELPSEPITPAEFKPLITQQLNDLLKDPNYTRITESIDGESVVTTVNNDITAYIWCRGLSADGQQGGWLNISPFVEFIQTQVNQQFGTFIIRAVDIACEYIKDRGWVAVNVDDYDYGSVRDDLSSQITNRSKVLFNTVVQNNDLVYIKFEKLAIDQELETRLRSDGIVISNTDISERIWDMIGLVDSVLLSTQPNSITTTISGRDLMKVWYEDGSYFFASQLAQQIFTDENSILAKRNLMEGVSGQLVGFAVTFKTIDLMLKFIFNKFSNIGIVPNSTFTGYGQRAIRSKYQLSSSKSGRSGGEIIEELDRSFLSQEREGVYRIMELVFDKAALNRVLADAGISHDNGAIINSIRKLCQWPFVEFYGDTYGDKFYTIVRKPPFDKEGYRGLVYDNVEVEDVQVDKRDNKVRSDRAIRNKSRRVVAGSKYTISDLVIDIDDADVLGEPQLTYHQEAFSWYRVIPRGYNLMQEAEISLAPAVPFDQYAKIWGNKALQVEYNYLPGDFVLDSKYRSNLDFVEAQIFYDLQYLIQSHQYLPFARRGTIVLTGNRLIKRGLFIYYKPTKEVFHVDSVSHTRSTIGQVTNRNTVLQVSRGLREDYIKGKQVKFDSGSKLVSYFSIINTNIDNKASINERRFLKNWKVDDDIFYFFIQRRQWEGD